MNRPWISCIIAAIAAVADNVVATNEPDGHAPPPPLLYAYIVFFLQLLLPQFDLDQRRFWGVVMLFKSTYYYYYFSKALTPPCGYTTLTLHTRQIWLKHLSFINEASVQYKHILFIHIHPPYYLVRWCVYECYKSSSLHMGEKSNFFLFKQFFVVHAHCTWWRLISMASKGEIVTNDVSDSKAIFFARLWGHRLAFYAAIHISVVSILLL